jgi:hypothetical protein
MISKTIDIVVTSVLQTTAGKMIFGRYLEPGAAPAPSGSRQSGSHVAVAQPAAGTAQPVTPPSPIVAKDR